MEHRLAQSLAVALVATSCLIGLSTPSFAASKNTRTIGMVLKETPSFKKVFMAIETAGMTPTLASKGPFTVFAPTDAAFNKVPQKVLNDLMKPENKAKLINILSYHVVAGKLPASELVKMKSLKTLQGKNLIVSNKGGILIDGVKVGKADIAASNGVIHAIDSVLLPK